MGQIINAYLELNRGTAAIAPKLAIELRPQCLEDRDFFAVAYLETDAPDSAEQQLQTLKSLDSSAGSLRKLMSAEQSGDQ